MTSVDKTEDVVSSVDFTASSDGYDETSDTYRTAFDPHTRPPSEPIVAAVGAATGRDPLDLPPLFSAIDSDALNALFAPTPAGLERNDGRVTFEYADQHVTMESNGTVTVQPTSSE